MNPHFDGRGHRTLGYMEMLERYRYDRRSVDVLRRFAPYRYLVIPDVEIIVKSGPMVALDLRFIYPGETISVCKNPNAIACDALRRLYRSGDTVWRVCKLSDGVMFSRRGCVIEDKSAVNYGIASAGG